MTQGYDAGAWADGPGPVYDRLADAVVALAPRPVQGALVLDLGAGTGAASTAVSRRGGRVVAVDLSPEMLAFDASERPPATVGDALGLPLRDACVDAAVAAFSLTHVDPPVRGLAELARVTRPGGWVLASSFDEERHPAKDAVDRALRAHGWTPPDWYERFKATTEPLFTSPDRFAGLGCAAGLVGVEVQRVSVDTGLRDPDAIVRYRFGMAQFLGFVEGLDADRRAQLWRDAVAEIGFVREPVCVLILVLAGRVG